MRKAFLGADLLLFALLPAGTHTIFNMASLVAFLPELAVAVLALKGPVLEVDTYVVLDITLLGVLHPALSALQNLVVPTCLLVEHLLLDYHGLNINFSGR